MMPRRPFPPTFTRRPPRADSPPHADNPNPRPTSPPRGSPGDILLHAAFDGNLHLVKITPQLVTLLRSYHFGCCCGVHYGFNLILARRSISVRAEMVKALDDGDGRLGEKVAAVRDSNGLNSLHLAAARARLPVCRYLVEELGLDVNASDINKGETPLTFAINFENVDMVRYLLDHGADTEKLNKDGLTRHFAAGQGLCEIVEALLSKGANINALTLGGTALHYACHNGRDGVVKILLDHHADHSKKTWGVYLPLVIAIYARSLSCVKLLLEMGQTPSEIAARFGSREDVEVLFPVTSRIPGVHDWCVDGIISFANSRPLDKSKDVHNAMLSGGKFQGREAVKNKDYLAATHIYTEAMDLDPNDATLYANRSFCWLHLGGGKSLLDAQACRAMLPGWSKACYREGAALMLLKDYEKSCDAFLDALKLEPENVETRNALREALESLEDIPQPCETVNYVSNRN